MRSSQTSFANFLSLLLALILGCVGFNSHAAGKNQVSADEDGCITAAYDGRKLDYKDGLNSLKKLLPAGKVGISLHDENFGFMPYWGKLSAEYKGSDFTIRYNRVGQSEVWLTNLHEDREHGEEFRKTTLQFYEGPNSLVLIIVTDQKAGLSWGPGYVTSQQRIEAQFIRNSDGSLKQIKVSFNNQSDGSHDEPGAFPLRVHDGWGPGNIDTLTPN